MTDTDIETQIQTLATTATQVAAAHAEQQAAISAERDAEAALLERVIEAVRPALRALSSRRRGIDRDWRGVEVAGVGKKKEYEYSANAGDIYGDGLYILIQDGTPAMRLSVATYSGRWDRDRDRDDEEITWREVTARQAVDIYDVDVVVARLSRLLDEQAAADRGVAKAQERAAKFAALTQLLGGAR